MALSNVGKGRELFEKTSKISMELSMKSTIATIAILALIGLGVGMSVGAAETADVSATVTAELITISVLDGSVAYGILPVNTNQDTVTLGDTQVVTNDGNVNVDLGVKSSDAEGGTKWELAASTGNLDEFTHESAPDGSTWTLFNVDNASYTSLAAGVAPAGTQNLDLRIKTPTSVTDGAEKTITVTVLATQS